jgi:predicted DNA-binding protein
MDKANKKVSNKYKSVALSHEMYEKLDYIRKNIIPNTTVSRAKAIEILVNKKGIKLNV